MRELRIISLIIILILLFTGCENSKYKRIANRYYLDTSKTTKKSDEVMKQAYKLSVTVEGGEISKVEGIMQLKEYMSELTDSLNQIKNIQTSDDLPERLKRLLLKHKKILVSAHSKKIEGLENLSLYYKTGQKKYLQQYKDAIDQSEKQKENADIIWTEIQFEVGSK